MASKVDVCNFSLSRLAIGHLIADIDETGNQAKQCRLWFDQSRKSFLTDFRYSFAKKQGLLGLRAGENLQGWTYAYDYPLDCLNVHFLGDQSLLAGVPQYINNDGWWQIGRAPFDLEQARYLNTWDFALSKDGDSKIILSNETAQGYIIYTADITKIELWPADAIDAFSYLLASNIGGPLKVDPKYIQLATGEYERLKSRAQARDLNERNDVLPRDTPSIRARMS